MPVPVLLAWLLLAATVLMHQPSGQQTTRSRGRTTGADFS